MLHHLADVLVAWGPLGILLLAIVDSLVPVAGLFDVLIAVLAAQRPAIGWWCAVCAVIGSTAGNYVLFRAAQRGGRRFLNESTSSARAKKFRVWFERYGLITVFIPALLPIPMPLKLFVISAGVLGSRTGVFLVVVLVARTARYFGMAWLGIQLGKGAGPFVLSHVPHFLAAAAALFVVLYLAVRLSDKRRREKVAKIGYPMSKKVAVVEDEAELAALVEYNLERNGFAVRVLRGAKNTLEQLEDFGPDLILLDVMLPETDGFELCRQVRQHPTLARTPILFLTARSEEVDRVLGLELGGDDYVTKPFSIRELMARVKAHLRRGEAKPEDPKSSLGPFALDRGAHRVFLNSRELELTSTEFKLLEFFLSHPGKAYSRDALLNEVWGEQHFVTPRTVDVHIRRLREQIEEKPDDPKYLVTVRGFGYRFEIV